MSREIWETDGLIVTRHVGPDTMGEDRQLWQFTPTVNDYVTLNRRQVRTLVLILMRDAWRVKRYTENA